MTTAVTHTGTLKEVFSACAQARLQAVLCHSFCCDEYDAINQAKGSDIEPLAKIVSGVASILSVPYFLVKL